MIKLKTVEQVAIDEHFIHLARDFFDNKLNYFPPRSKEALDILKYYTSRQGFEMFLTRLKQLEYQTFTGIRSLNQSYIKAVTKEMAPDYGEGSRKRKVEIGAYAIYISMNALLHGNINDYHFIPARKPIADEPILSRDRTYSYITHYRHLHHYADFNSHEGHYKNPLSYRPKTCWGTFGSMMPSIAQDGDLAELFRALYLFLFVQNPNSPLVHISNLTHYKWA